MRDKGDLGVYEKKIYREEKRDLFTWSKSTEISLSA